MIKVDGWEIERDARGRGVARMDGAAVFVVNEEGGLDVGLPLSAPAKTGASLSPAALRALLDAGAVRATS